MKPIYRVVLLLIATFSATVASAKTESLEARLQTLDSCLQNKSEYDKIKEKKILQHKEAVNKARTAEKKYDACIRLYDEYKSYMYDSAYAYATRSAALAQQLNNSNYKVESDCAMTFCLLSAGLYKEAFDKLRDVSTEGISPKYKKIYYNLVIQLNYAIADYNHAEPYHNTYLKRGSAYTDSLLAMADRNSLEWKYATAQKQMKEYKYKESMATFADMLKTRDIDLHTKAIATSCLGWMHWHNQDEQTAIRYLTEAAICDVMSSTKETTALRGLAELLYKNNEIQRATEYIQLSLDDANFYGARQRKIEVGEILPIIETNRYEILQSKTNILVGAVVIISILVITILIAFFYLYRQKKILQEARNKIRKNNDALQAVNNQLQAANTQLQQANLQLQEANNIKNEYIGNSFYINSEFIEKMEKLYLLVDRKIQTKQYDDLRLSLKESVLKKERDNMFAVFDSTFLRIFPNFVEQYNNLFPGNDRKTPEKKMSLTVEMRIFALIRLGISESERIAKFLNYSVHTINTYKTRVKNKSLIENEMFEKHIMRIGVTIK